MPFIVEESLEHSCVRSGFFLSEMAARHRIQLLETLGQLARCFRRDYQAKVRVIRTVLTYEKAKIIFCKTRESRRRLLSQTLVKLVSFNFFKHMRSRVHRPALRTERPQMNRSSDSSGGLLQDVNDHMVHKITSSLLNIKNNRSVCQKLNFERSQPDISVKPRDMSKSRTAQRESLRSTDSISDFLYPRTATMAKSYTEFSWEKDNHPDLVQEKLASKSRLSASINCGRNTRTLEALANIDKAFVRASKRTKAAALLSLSSFGRKVHPLVRPIFSKKATQGTSKNPKFYTELGIDIVCSPNPIARRPAAKVVIAMDGVETYLTSARIQGISCD